MCRREKDWKRDMYIHIYLMNKNTIWPVLQCILPLFAKIKIKYVLRLCDLQEATGHEMTSNLHKEARTEELVKWREKIVQNKFQLCLYMKALIGRHRCGVIFVQMLTDEMCWDITVWLFPVLLTLGNAMNQN